MNLSQKCQYALRSLLELAKRDGRGPVPIAQIAESQAIPPRFLELILGELKHAGYVESRRGVQGGYMLAKPSSGLTVGEIIRFVDGPLNPVQCLGAQKKQDCPLRGRCVFVGLWDRATQAVEQVYDSTTFQDLIDEERAGTQVTNYTI